MRNVTRLLTLILLAAPVLALGGCSTDQPGVDQSSRSNAAEAYISVRNAAIMSDLDSATVIDTRDYVDYVAGHIAVSINIPASQMSLRARELSHDKTVILVGEDGSAENARDVLLENGFKDNEVLILDGSIDEWPTERIIAEIPAC